MSNEPYAEKLLWFADLMQCELLANAHKEHWLNRSAPDLLQEITKHVNKLHTAYADGDNEKIKEHAADVGNCAMMLLDKLLLLLPNEVVEKMAQNTEERLSTTERIIKYDDY
jgi:hypothetical protein